MAVSANKLELLQIADAVAREKSIDRGIVIAAMEDAIAKAARARYGSETDVHAEIDAKKGELRLSRHMLVVEQVENSSHQISLADAQRGTHGGGGGRATCWSSSRSRTPRPVFRWRTRSAPTRAPRSATPSPIRCRRWNMAA